MNDHQRKCFQGDLDIDFSFELGGIDLLKEAMGQGVQEGCQTFDLALHLNRRISLDEAIPHADSPNNLRLHIRNEQLKTEEEGGGEAGPNFRMLRERLRQRPCSRRDSRGCVLGPEGAYPGRLTFVSGFPMRSRPGMEKSPQSPEARSLRGRRRSGAPGRGPRLHRPDRAGS